MQGGYVPGSLVNVRGRDWVVLPPDQPEELSFSPLIGGSVAVVGDFFPVNEWTVRPSISRTLISGVELKDDRIECA